MSLYGDLPPPSIGQATPGDDGRFPAPTESPAAEVKETVEENNDQKGVQAQSRNAEKGGGPTRFNPAGRLLTPAAIKRKHQTAQQQKPLKTARTSNSQTAALTKTSSLGPTSPENEVQEEPLERAHSHGASTSSGIEGPTQQLFSEYAAHEVIKDEYDPARPNDYDIVLQEREDARNKERLERELQRRREEERRIRDERERERERAAREEDAQAKRQRSLGTSAEEVMRRRAALSRRGPEPPQPPQEKVEDKEEATSSASTTTAQTIAQRMMMKMGWKAGQGLGKKEQGITAPIELRKTDRDRGVIVQPPKGPRVVVLRNMVAPGEVDHDLNREVEEECNRKYGKVESLLIYEVPETLQAPIEERVRIFVKFDQPSSAKQAIADLNGRFFGGREVRAKFFDESRLDNFDLNPKPEDMRR